jgi:hypothetical protein
LVRRPRALLWGFACSVTACHSRALLMPQAAPRLSGAQRCRIVCLQGPRHNRIARACTCRSRSCGSSLYPRRCNAAANRSLSPHLCVSCVSGMGALLIAFYIDACCSICEMQVACSSARTGTRICGGTRCFERRVLIRPATLFRESFMHALGDIHLYSRL